MPRSWMWPARAMGAAATLAAVGCGGGETDPTPPVTIAKAAANSGDAQIGEVSQALPLELRVVITRDGDPARDVTVEWTTSNGTLSPASDKSDVDGESTSLWTLGSTVGPQAATARVTGGTGVPVTFTATATDDGGGGGGATATVQVGPALAFTPAVLNVSPGTTVTWEWAGTLPHNVAPDVGTTPTRSGDVTTAPNSFDFTFNTPGTYRYFCEQHGSAGGGGMSGTIVVGAVAR